MRSGRSRSGNGAGSEGYRNRLECRPAFLLLTLRSYALDMGYKMMLAQSLRTRMRWTKLSHVEWSSWRMVYSNEWSETRLHSVTSTAQSCNESVTAVKPMTSH